MLTTSDTAPMVQKLVLLAMNPKINAKKKPDQATTSAGFSTVSTFYLLIYAA
jgi:hypothetical protein